MQKAAVSGKQDIVPEISEGTGLSDGQLDRLRARLLAEREGIRARMRRHVAMAVDHDRPPADDMDLASRAQEQAMLLRLADKDRKLLGEIEHALAKFVDGQYGLCEGTDEPIGWKRLWARPSARHSIAFKERLEQEAHARRR